MPLLRNNTDQGVIFNPQVGVHVPARQAVQITDEQAALVNTASGVWVVEPDPEPDKPSRAATRKTTPRGETSGAPVMETRG